MKSPLTILVNSTDSYRDCWLPFFTLFQRYWPDCPYPVVLNTETEEFQFPGLDIVCSTVGDSEHGRRLTWSEILLKCLDQIDSEYILWTLDDLFFTGRVKQQQVASLLDLMRTEDLTHIHLTPTGANANAYQPSPYPGVWQIRQDFRYRLSLINGLWRKERFRSYIRWYESPWQLEVFGSQRARKVRDSFYCVATSDPTNPVTWPIPYLFSGITKGKWDVRVPELFGQHGISMDFSRRGFYVPPHPLLRRVQLGHRLVSGLWQRWHPPARRERGC